MQSIPRLLHRCEGNFEVESKIVGDDSIPKIIEEFSGTKANFIESAIDFSLAYEGIDVAGLFELAGDFLRIRLVFDCEVAFQGVGAVGILYHIFCHESGGGEGGTIKPLRGGQNFGKNRDAFRAHASLFDFD